MARDVGGRVKDEAIMLFFLLIMLFPNAPECVWIWIDNEHVATPQGMFLASLPG